MTLESKSLGTQVVARRKAVARSAAALSALVLLLGLAAWALLSLPAGRAFVAERVLNYVSSASGQLIKAGSVEGDWPTRFVLADVTVADSKGVWLTADHMEFTLRPWELIGGHLYAESIVVNTAVLRSLPGGSGNGDSRRIALPNAPNIFEILSGMTIDDARLNVLLLEEAVLGQRTEASVQISLKQNQDSDEGVLSVRMVRRDEPGRAELRLQASSSDASLDLRGTIAGLGLAGRLSIADHDNLSGSLEIDCQSAPCAKFPNGNMQTGSARISLGGTSRVPEARAQFSLADLTIGDRPLRSLSGQVNVRPLDRDSEDLSISAGGNIDGVLGALPEISTIASDAGTWSLSALVTGDILAVADAQIDLGDTVLSGLGRFGSTGIESPSLTVAIRGPARLWGQGDDASDLRANLSAQQIDSFASFRGQIDMSVTGLALAEPLMDGTLLFKSTTVFDGETLSLNDVNASAGALSLS
ncbi:MAG: hypothetical protein RLN70_05750, partial [Rhodospirillaceae bacterium]